MLMAKITGKTLYVGRGIPARHLIHALKFPPHGSMHINEKRVNRGCNQAR
jgi:hypothetical protein